MVDSDSPMEMRRVPSAVPSATGSKAHSSYSTSSSVRRTGASPGPPVDEDQIRAEATTLLEGLQIPRASYSDGQLQAVESVVSQVYPFIRQSETHRHVLLSLTIKIEKKTLGGTGTAIELLAGLLSLAGGPSFTQDLVFTLDKVSENQGTHFQKYCLH